jgi:hypothetical protein
MTWRRIIVRVDLRVCRALDVASTTLGGRPRSAVVRSTLAAHDPAHASERDKAALVAFTAALREQPPAVVAPKSTRLPGPSVRARVRAAAQDRPGKEYTAPEIARALGAHAGTVRNELLKLARAGAIEKLRVGCYRTPARGRR